MDTISFLLFLIWAACGVLVVQFVLKTGGTEVGRVAHWFGGAFVMFGFAVALIVAYAQCSPTFAGKVNAYLLTHLIKDRTQTNQFEAAVIPVVLQTSNGTSTIGELQQPSVPMVIFRPGLVSSNAYLNGDQLNLSQSSDTRTSLWWMLWDGRYSSPGL